MRLGNRLMPLAAGAILLVWASSPTTVGAVPAARAQQPGRSLRRPVTVIMQCVYYSAGPSTAFRTEVRGIEVSSGNDLGLESEGSVLMRSHACLCLGSSINSNSAVADYTRTAMLMGGTSCLAKGP